MLVVQITVADTMREAQRTLTMRPGRPTANCIIQALQLAISHPDHGGAFCTLAAMQNAVCCSRPPPAPSPAVCPAPR